ncbi:MAG: hypothetical protein WCI05_11695 [Myxococcales bacterium]|jgi:hypothetical protein
MPTNSTNPANVVVATETPNDKEPIDTLEDLVERTGGATEEEALAFVEGMTDAELVALGAEVATSRIDTDTARLYGKAHRFFLTATPERLAAVPGVTSDMLRVAVWTARQGQVKAQQRQRAHSAKGGDKAVRKAEAQTTRDTGLLRREQLHRALLTLGKKDSVTKLQISGAYGIVTTPSDHSASLVAMAKLARTMLADDSPGAVLRRKGSALTEGWLKETEELASQVEKTGASGAAVRGEAEVTQADVDLYDGINLRLLEAFIDSFEAGHGVDPSVPRLVPNALRRWFDRGARHTTPATPPATPATPGPSAAGGTT